MECDYGGDDTGRDKKVAKLHFKQKARQELSLPENKRESRIALCLNWVGTSRDMGYTYGYGIHTSGPSATNWLLIHTSTFHNGPTPLSASVSSVAE